MEELLFCLGLYSNSYKDLPDKDKQGPTRHRPMAHPVVCLDIFPTPQRLQNMPLIAYGGG